MTTAPNKPTLAEPPWLSIARGEMSVAEIRGTEHNPRILMYFTSTTFRAEADEVPWCSAFANWCMLQAKLPRTNNAKARSWLQYGVALQAPLPGAIMVYSADGRGPDAGHVGFWVPARMPIPGHDSVLGGNQANRVCVRPYPRARLLGIRWPSSFAPPPPFGAVR